MMRRKENMDIEKQFETAFSRITLDNGQPLVSVEPEIVHACVVNNDFAKITLILPEDSPLRGSLPAQVEAEIKKIDWKFCYVQRSDKGIFCL